MEGDRLRAISFFSCDERIFKAEPHKILECLVCSIYPPDSAVEQDGLILAGSWASVDRPR